MAGGIRPPFGRIIPECNSLPPISPLLVLVIPQRPEKGSWHSTWAAPLLSHALVVLDQQRLLLTDVVLHEGGLGTMEELLEFLAL